jgi:hypothetical protein
MIESPAGVRLDACVYATTQPSGESNFPNPTSTMLLSPERMTKVMKLKSAAATVGAAFILAAAPAFASTTPPQDGPIRLDSIQIAQPIGIDMELNPGLLTVAYTNMSAVPATKVVFVLQSNGQALDHYVDVGKFSPGVVIRHSFADSHLESDQQLEVETVAFADGTAWTNAAPRTRRQASSGDVSAENLFPFVAY